MSSEAGGPSERLGSGVALILSVLWTTGCAEPPSSDASGIVSDSAGVRIVELQASFTVPARSLDVDADWMQGVALELGRLGDVEPLPDGGAVVLDEMSGTVSVLAPDGEVRAGLGGFGEGPGEFSPHGGISKVIVAGPSLLVPDIQLQRITEFSMDGEVLAVHAMPGSDPAQGPVHAVDWRAHPDGGIMFRSLSLAGDVLLRADERGVDTLHVFEILSPVPNRLLPPTSVWDLDVEGRVVVGRSDRGRIEVRVPGDEAPLLIVRWGGGRPEVTSRDRSHLEELLLSSAEAQGMDRLSADQRERILSSVTLPETAPVVAAVLADPQGRIWVQEAAPIPAMGTDALRVGIAAGFGGNRWRVLRADGLLEEAVTLPDGFSPRRFVENCMYGILEDDLGVQRPARVCY